MKKILSLFVVLSLITGGAAFWLYSDYKSYLDQPLPLTDEMIFEVDKGLSFNGILAKLKAANIKINEPYLKYYARDTSLGRKIKAGEYRFKANMTPRQLMTAITSGRSISYNFTIIEGSQYKQLLASIKSNPYLVNDVEALTNQQLLSAIGSDYKHIEGLFLAETYSFEKNSSALAVLKRAHDMLLLKLNNEWSKRNKKLPYKKPYEALIMASIVEKETARADERPVIAGVFVRRLNKRMRLQTDPTVIYGMGDAYKGNIRRSDLRKPTPYNTYTIPALPPTPIAMVGPEAITASLNPTSGKSLYFVAKGDGSHYFSATLAEHNKAVRKYQLSRRKDYRSSP